MSIPWNEVRLYHAILQQLLLSIVADSIFYDAVVTLQYNSQLIVSTRLCVCIDTSFVLKLRIFIFAMSRVLTEGNMELHFMTVVVVCRFMFSTRARTHTDAQLLHIV